MVYSDELGYDPDEWEECPPPDHFLVFAPFTRLLLSITAIIVAALFYYLVEHRKEVGRSKKEEKEDKVQERIVHPVQESPRVSSSSSSSLSPLSILSSILSGGIVNGEQEGEFNQRSLTSAAVPQNVLEGVQKRFEYTGVQAQKTPEQMAAELRNAEYELRDLLQGSETAPVSTSVPGQQGFIQKPFSEAQKTAENLSVRKRQEQTPLQQVQENLGHVYENISTVMGETTESVQRLGSDGKRTVEEATHSVPQLIQGAPDALEDHYQRVQKGLTDLVQEDELRIEVPTLQQQQNLQRERLQETVSPIDEHIERLQQGILTGQQPQMSRPGEISLHDVYEQQQQQMQPRQQSPPKLPTPQEAAALRSWEDELARMEADKVAKLNDIIVGGDDSSVAISDLLPADKISMGTSQESELRRIDELQSASDSIPAAQRINNKMEQISSELEKSLLDEIEQLARHTHTMQNELARARESEYTSDEISEAQLDPSQDVFQRSRDVKFIPATEGQSPHPLDEMADELAVRYGQEQQRESRDSDDYVKVTPPHMSGHTSPIEQQRRGMSPEEEKEMEQLVKEYDMVDNGNGQKAEFDRCLDLVIVGGPSSSSPMSPSSDILSDYEKISAPTSPRSALEAQLQQHPVGVQQQVLQQVQQQQQPQQYRRDVPTDEQVLLEQVMREFDAAHHERVDVLSMQGVDKTRPPQTPPQTPDTLLSDPFTTREQQRTDMLGHPTELEMDERRKSTTEIILPLAPKYAMQELREQFPDLPTQGSIEVVEEPETDLPPGVLLPADQDPMETALEEPTAPFIHPDHVVNLDEKAEEQQKQEQQQQQREVFTSNNGDLHGVFREPGSLGSLQTSSGPSASRIPKLVDPFGRPISFAQHQQEGIVAKQPAQIAVTHFDAFGKPLTVQTTSTIGVPQQQMDAFGRPIQVETPIMSAPSPYAEMDRNTPQVPIKQISLDLSHPLQPAMSTFDRPEGSKPHPVIPEEESNEAYFTTRQRPVSSEDMKATLPQRSGKAKTPEELRNMAEADLYLQDAIEYVAAHRQLQQQMTGQVERKDTQPQSSGFVMEEEMLSSHGEGLKTGGTALRPSGMDMQPSGDGTSRMVKTNEVFDRMDVHDEHDDMTYAPEIQSVEIPPDQMSEASDNLHDEIPLDYPYGGPSEQAQRLVRNIGRWLAEQEMRAQEQALEEAANAKAMQHKAALAQAPHIVSIGSAHHPRFPSTPSISSATRAESPRLRKQSSLLSILGVTSTQEMLLKIDSLEALSAAMRKAGLESTNVIFGIDYTASNKYQGEESFGGHSLHTIHPNLKNPYQQVITILGRTLAPFTSTGCIPVYGFGDARTSDWSVFPLKERGVCTSLDEVLKTYNEVTPTVELSGPTNFSPLIYQAIEICQKTREYHILVIIADGQVTNEKATRRAIVQACQYPMSIIVVGVGDGPWDMMKVFDDSLPKRPWDNFHFVEFHKVVKKAAAASSDADVKVAIQSLLEIPDQYRCICNLGLLNSRSPSIISSQK